MILGSFEKLIVTIKESWKRCDTTEDSFNKIRRIKVHGHQDHIQQGG